MPELLRGEVINGDCCHCGKSTCCAWIDSRADVETMVHICSDCMNKAMVGYYLSPAYEKVGQATYYKPLERKTTK